MLLIAEFLPSKFFDFFKNCYEADKQWCQGGDLNPRPPAYESEATFIGEILSKQTYKQLKHDKQCNSRTLTHIKNTEALTLDFTLNSLQLGQKKENNCRVFADQVRSAEARLFSFTKLIKSIYMSIYSDKKFFLRTIFTSCFNVKKLNRYSYKLTSSQLIKGETR